MLQYHVRIKVDEFAQLSSAVTQFADKADAIGGNTGTVNSSLRNEMSDQVRLGRRHGWLRHSDGGLGAAL